MDRCNRLTAHHITVTGVFLFVSLPRSKSKQGTLNKGQNASSKKLRTNPLWNGEYDTPLPLFFSHLIMVFVTGKYVLTDGLAHEISDIPQICQESLLQG